MTLYTLKPRFQDQLRPLVATLPRFGVTANQVTVAAALGSVLAGAVATRLADSRRVFLIIPVWLLARMALNAIDGMLAREFHQKSVLGGYLNEIGDVVSDAALYAPFASVAPFGSPGIGLVIVLSIMAELAGVLGPTMGASRRSDGPMGKSDRAVVFAGLGLWIGCLAPMPAWLRWAVPILAALLVLTVMNRVRSGVGEARNAGSEFP
jgi:phosphatidylglycerophosphate synthase